MASPPRKPPPPTQYRTPSDLSFLEDLLLASPRTGVSATLSPVLHGKQRSTASVAAARRKKVPERLRHATATTVRQALFPSGAGSYPAENSPLRGSQASRRRELGDEAAANNDEPSEQQEWKRREMCWSTSFPAEYLRAAGTQRTSTKLTLAFHEQQLERRRQKQLEQHQEQHQRLARARELRATETDEALRRLRAQATAREELLAQLRAVVAAATQQQAFDVSRGDELLHLLLELRSASVAVMERLADWHGHCMERAASPKRVGAGIKPAPAPPSFVLAKGDYCAKMVSDLDFLSGVSALGGVLGVDPAKMRQNPFMMPEPISQREFSDAKALAWCELSMTSKRARGQPQGGVKGRQGLTDDRGNQVAERVAEAETYLVWCLFNLEPLALPPPSEGEVPSPSSPPCDPVDCQSPPRSTLASWQVRAEKQLELLSRPLESSSGRAYVMDSSPMMKRKGVLPSLPLSPPKTLTELMDSVHQLPGAEPPLSKVSELLAVEWAGSIFRCSTRELGALGSLGAPPHQLVAVVAASVLILLSPPDRLPKDLSWTSSRKMLLGGARLVDRLGCFDAASTPEFKWKALAPFLQHEQFQPQALLPVSAAAACLCAWVLSGLRQRRELTAAASEASDVDRLELLGELEVDDVESGASVPTGRPIASGGADEELSARPKSKLGKRVSIGSAEILFINENQPVAPTPTPLHSRPSSPLPLSLPAAQGPKMLVRTSPWSFKGVSYFVSFFLEPPAPPSDRAALSIKLYEPMSSVESQIFVTEEDLREDFGAAALSAFRRREYGGVSDLILGQLDRMMGGRSDRSDVESERDGAEPSALDLLAREETAERSDECVSAREGGLEDGDAGYEDKGETEAEERPPSRGERDAAAVRIQCLARRQSAKRTCARLAEERRGDADGDVSGSADAMEQLVEQPMEQPIEQPQQQAGEEEEGDSETGKTAAALRIQCAARQKQARERVQQARYSWQRTMDDEERRRRILERVPTGVPGEQELPLPAPRRADLGAFTEAEDDGEGDDATEEGAAAESAAAASEAQDDAIERAEGETAAGERPETAMSYASEQFEDDFDEE